MDQYTTKIRSKMSKMETSLLDLTNEILTAVKFLFQLRENSVEIVKNLNSITTPEIYLKEFVNVNSFILKYLNFLTEVNCKFEMLEMSGKSSSISIPVNKSKSETGSENISQTDSSLHCGFIKNLDLTEDYGTLKKLYVQGFLDTQHSLNKPNKDKSDNINSVNNSDKNNINARPKSFSDTNFSQMIFSSEKILFDNNVDHSQMILQPYNSGAIDCLKESLLESEILSFSSSFSFSKKEKLMQTSFKKASSSTFIDSPNTSSPDGVQNSDTQSGSGDNLRTEDVSIKLCSTGVIKDLNCLQGLDSENFRTTEPAKPNKNNTKNGDIKPVNIRRKFGKEYDVVIKSIKSPSEFYVSIKDKHSYLLVELENKLKLIPKVKNKFCIKRLDKRKAELSKEFGNYALFYSKCDEIWCRAEITNWRLNFPDDFVTVYLLDYGESKCVSLDDLQSMPECFKEYPAFAQRCHLHGVFPLNIDQKNKILLWKKGSTEKMRSLTESSGKIKMKIAADDCFHSVNSLPVTLWLADQDNQCVNQLLVESKYAVQQSAVDQQLLSAKINDSCIVEEENLNNWNPMKEDFESYQNSYDLDMNDPAAVIYGYVGNDYKRICSHFAKTGRCFKGGACKKEHQKLDPLGFTTDQEEIYNSAFNTLPVPPPKAVVSVQITCFLTFNQFCCIPMDDFYSGEENLHSLLKFMNKVENVREMKKLLIPPSTGQIVIARYSEDYSWYRARILESQPEKDLYTVLFVDYGNKEILSLSSIRAIEARYLHLPFQSMQCFIFGVDRNPKVPLKDVMDYINERIYNENVTIEVVSRLPGEGTNLLVHVFDYNGRNIGNDLIAKEYAICKSEILISGHSESIPG